MTELQLYNTATRKKQIVKAIEGNHIKMYTCGPTVYHYAHIGNFRTYMFEDLLRRTLKFFGFKVEQVMNLTDVDDKTIRGATQKKISLDEFTKPFKEAFFEDLNTLGIEPAEHYPQATDYIPQMIEMIETLLKKEIAYKGADGSIYFAIAKCPHYGCLSHLKLDELQSGDRVNNDEYEKETVADFVLWKAYDPERDGAIYWDSPYGKGRPGWHLECSAMAMNILGETIDIHCGGIDNMFPHHENEIAQSECASGKTFVNLWMHSEHLIVDNKKMSKSLGNFYTLRDLMEKGYTGNEVRYMLLHTHYKTQLNFTFQGLDSVRSSLSRLRDFIIRLRECEGEETGSLNGLIEKSLSCFKASLGDDLNISEALACLFEFVRETNGLIDQKKVGAKDAEKAFSFLEHLNTVLNILPLKTQEKIPPHLISLLEERKKARDEKNWALADKIRIEFQSHGYVVEDTAQGARLKKC